jgi:hypothetical protein
MIAVELWTSLRDCANSYICAILHHAALTPRITRTRPLGRGVRTLAETRCRYIIIIRGYTVCALREIRFYRRCYEWHKYELASKLRAKYSTLRLEMYYFKSEDYSKPEPRHSIDSYWNAVNEVAPLFTYVRCSVCWK